MSMKEPILILQHIKTAENVFDKINNIYTKNKTRCTK